MKRRRVDDGDSYDRNNNKKSKYVAHHHNILYQLCDDVLGIIVSYLATKEWIILSRVCKHFHHWRDNAEKQKDLFNKMFTILVKRIRGLSRRWKEDEAQKHIFNLRVVDILGRENKRGVRDAITSSHLINLRQLEYSGDCIPVDSFKEFHNLTCLKARNDHTLTDDTLAQITTLQRVELNRCAKVNGKGLVQLSELAIVQIEKCNSFNFHIFNTFSPKRRITLTAIIAEKGQKTTFVKNCVDSLASIHHHLYSIRISIAYSFCTDTATLLSKSSRLCGLRLISIHNFGRLDIFQNITDLSLSKCKAVPYRGLTTLTRLRHLSVEDCEIYDIDLQSEYLMSLSLTNCRKIHHLSYLPSLVDLALTECTSIVDAAFLNAPNLARLYAEQCHKITGESLPELEQLHTLQIKKCMRFDVNNLNSIPHLQSIRYHPYSQKKMARFEEEWVQKPQNPNKNRCHVGISGRTYIYQMIYECITCNLTSDLGCCLNCALQCHAGHQIVEVGYKSFECDCYLSPLPCKCLIR